MKKNKIDPVEPCPIETPRDAFVRAAQGIVVVKPSPQNRKPVLQETKLKEEEKKMCQDARRKKKTSNENPRGLVRLGASSPISQHRGVRASVRSQSTLTQSRHNDRAKKMTSPSMLLSLDRPSPAVVAPLTLEAVAGEEEVAVAVVDDGNEVEIVDVVASVGEAAVVVLPLIGGWPKVRVKFAELVDDADVLGRLQLVVEDVEQSEDCAAAPEIWLVSSFADARVAAPRTASRWEGRIWTGWVDR